MSYIHSRSYRVPEARKTLIRRWALQNARVMGRATLHVISIAPTRKDAIAFKTDLTELYCLAKLDSDLGSQD